MDGWMDERDSPTDFYSQRETQFLVAAENFVIVSAVQVSLQMRIIHLLRVGFLSFKITHNQDAFHNAIRRILCSILVRRHVSRLLLRNCKWRSTRNWENSRSQLLEKCQEFTARIDSSNHSTGSVLSKLALHLTNDVHLPHLHQSLARVIRADMDTSLLNSSFTLMEGADMPITLTTGTTP